MVASKMFNPFISRAVIVWPLFGAERGAPVSCISQASYPSDILGVTPSTRRQLLGVPIVWAERAALPSVAGCRRSFGSGSGDAGGGGEGCASSGCPGLRKGHLLPISARVDVLL